MYENKYTNKEDVCIVIPSHLTGKVIYDVLESISRLNYPRDKILINIVLLSDDLETYNYVNKALHDFNLRINTYFTSSPNVDVKRNLGIMKCNSSKYVLVIDDDILIHPETISIAIRHVNEDPKVGVVGFPVISDCKSLNERLNHCKYINTVTTHNATMPITFFLKDVLDKVGLFREDMGPPLSIHEDWEMGSRIRKHGYKVIVDGRYPGKDLGSQTLRKLISTKASNRSISNKRGVVKYIVNYVKSYVNKGWWSMLQVFKSSPLDQLLEYAFYLINPLLFAALMIINWILGLGYLGVVIMGILINTFIKRYYSIFPIKQRITYPLLLIGIRIFRTYLFLLALLINAFKLLIR